MTNAECKRVVQAANVAAFIISCITVSVLGVIGGRTRGKDDGGNLVTEQVERKTWRIEKRHDGCPSNGFWRVCGNPERIDAFGIDKLMWPHKCSGCCKTNSFYDVRYPQFSNEWVRVRK